MLGVVQVVLSVSMLVTVVQWAYAVPEPTRLPRDTHKTASDVGDMVQWIVTEKNKISDQNKKTNSLFREKHCGTFCDDKGCFRGKTQGRLTSLFQMLSFP